MDEYITFVQTPGVHIKQCEADAMKRSAQNNYPSCKQPQAQKTLMLCCNAWPAHAADTQRYRIDCTQMSQRRTERSSFQR